MEEDQYPALYCATNKASIDAQSQYLSFVRTYSFLLITAAGLGVYGINQNIWDRYRNVLGIWMYQILNNQNPSEIQFTTSDLNFDGNINILDIIQLANMILSENYIENADLNNDGNLNILDIVSIVNIILNN